MKKLSTILAILLFSFNAYAMQVIEKSPYPDYYETDWRIDTNVVDGNKIPLNGKHITEYNRIGVVPGCTSSTECGPLITSVQFFVNGVETNTEATYPYDLKYPADAASAEEIDQLPNGTNVVKAIVTKADSSTVEMLAQFYSGEIGVQAIHDLTLYHFTSDKSLTVQWDQAIGATDYELRLWSVERQDFALVAKIPDSGNSTSKTTIQIPFTGHFIGYIRSIDQPLAESQKETINNQTSIEDLKNLIPYACDIDWEENITLEEMKAKVIAVNAQCSEWTITTDAENCQVTLPDGTFEFTVTLVHN
jgi:hypothetical protein